ncbi:Protein of unknown function [Bradyrhizobium brasilense]|uniref:DUF4007 domain-containing protein n=1 Tax=Bradyrhizobium brasilense TaxID=1419277 RepID=A0A1G6RVA0_9BRAD|nr:DUF4007 family protein [Bradyrhizobium brasilense]SDD08488.1 Protein of unknown function [Bradyrhizobium brasilense]
MLRGPITAEDFRGQFSGHETFPLRHLWLRKAFDAVGAGKQRTVFTDPDAIVTFGVGKNMALSIRHWALACGIIKEEGSRVKATELGTHLFGDENPWDPYMERPATAWLMHWLVAGDPEMTTTWYWAFNHLPAQTFDHDTLAKAILEYCRLRKWPRIADKTVERDVECFVRSYVPRGDKNAAEDAMEPVLAELGLIRQVAGRLYEFRRGPKPSLPDGVFAYALNEFWDRYAQNASTLSVEAISYEPGSPGRVFKLDENSVVERLTSMERVTRHRIVWSDTAGIRQVHRVKPISDPFGLLGSAYRGDSDKRRAA